MNYKSIILLFIFQFFISCQNEEEAYIMQAIDLIEKNAFNAEKIDWTQLKDEAITKVKNSNTRETSYEIIKNTIALLNDNHSSFVPPSVSKQMYRSKKKIPKIESHHYKDDIGYLNIPSFTGNDSLANVFATQIQYEIQKLDALGVQNWIVDLRNNHGGNMWSMLLGLSSLLDEGTLGYFVSKNNEFSPWILKDGAMYSSKNKISSFDESYALTHEKRKIAVLIDYYTCSSAEAVAIAFLCAENTKLIGSKTCGKTTGNSRFQLSDGAFIVLKTSTFANAKKVVYGTEIVPDRYSDQPKIDAVNWIRKDSL